MILADTSVWISHLHRPRRDLMDALMGGQAVMHPFVIGELACGRIRRRKEQIALMRAMPAIAPASHDEVMVLIEERKLHGRGIGWVDAHLLAAALLAQARLLTDDRALQAAARVLGVAA